MSADLQPVMLVILGSLISLLGTVIALTLQMRLARQQARREVKIQDYRDLQAYLFAISRLYAVMEQQLKGRNEPFLALSKEDFRLHIDKALQQIQDSPLSSIPITFIIDDRGFLKEYGKITANTDYLIVLINQMKQGNWNVLNYDELHNEFMMKQQVFDSTMEKVLKIAERKLVR